MIENIQQGAPYIFGVVLVGLAFVFLPYFITMGAPAPANPILRYLVGILYTALIVVFILIPLVILVVLSGLVGWAI